ncbi:MAG: FliA/WhiG family RNA polymerase sigma factor [Betaproteobacteria bacterium]|nr:FliA/WhiG family RNA polymerase sigma factor [Betaproteobacteria bacterium]
MSTGSAAKKQPVQEKTTAKGTPAGTEAKTSRYASESGENAARKTAAAKKQATIQQRAQNSATDPMRNQVIMDYAPLIKYIAQKIAARLPSNIDLDDLFSAGVIGLMDAIDKYDPGRDNKFKTYAEFRIRGAILDELRNQDWVPRSVRETNKREERARYELEQELKRPPEDKEVADRLQMPLEEFHAKSGRTRVSMLSLEELGGVHSGDKKSLLECLENPNSKNPFMMLKQKGVRDIILKTVEELPEKQKLVLSLYYYEDLNLKEIGKILDVTESRVSQLHTQAVSKMRAKLKNLLQE